MLLGVLTVFKEERSFLDLYFPLKRTCRVFLMFVPFKMGLLCLLGL